ncbi:unnamed protein product [Trichogramma brassicae]|uniref:RNA-directed DNA polymerase n=1 Tax=Trichogramma brassicae TaxID=86971 RepID=A0A6H5IT21_9HYME|nr:unnamed protein product [Trichogramma brassicae]
MTQRGGKRSRVHLNKASFTAKKDASMCDCSEVKHLRARVNCDKMNLDRSQIKEILNFSIPTSAKQLRRFLSMCSWYRKFSKDYENLTEPLTRLTRTQVKYVWSEEQQEAFEKIKTQMSEALQSNYTNFKTKFVVQTEASDTSLGAVLLQNIDATRSLDEQRLVEHLNARSSPELFEASHRRAILCNAGLRPYSRKARASRPFCKAFPVTIYI